VAIMNDATAMRNLTQFHRVKVKQYKRLKRLDRAGSASSPCVRRAPTLGRMGYLLQGDKGCRDWDSRQATEISRMLLFAFLDLPLIYK
jgi:hypothetical protein